MERLLPSARRRCRTTAGRAGSRRRSPASRTAACRTCRGGRSASSSRPRSPRARDPGALRARARRSSAGGGARATRAGAASRTAACRRGTESVPGNAAATSQIGSSPGSWAEKPWSQGWSLTPRIPCSTTQRSTSAAAPGSRGSTVAKATRRSGAAATNAASESFAAGDGWSRPSYVNTTDTSTPSSSIASTYSSGPYQPDRGWWTWKSITPQPSARIPTPCAIRSASSRLARASASPGTGAVPSST